MEALGGYRSRPSSAGVRVRVRAAALLLSAVLGLASFYLLHSRGSPAANTADFYRFQVKDSRGRSVSLEKYRGKVCLVVNVASHDETSEWEFRGLQQLYRELGPSLFTVLAFPCAQFGSTESGTSRDTEALARNSYGVTFPVLDRIKIMGSEAEPAFRFLTDSVQQIPKWNFWKFLVNTEGQVVKFWKADEPMEDMRQEVMTHVRNLILKKRQEL